MNEPKITRRTDGSLMVEDLAPWFVDALTEIPNHLVEEPPEAVKARLFPDPVDDEETNRQWRRMMHPELKALMLDARALVVEDLSSLQAVDEHGFTWQLQIQPKHLNAWISAINTARLSLATQHEIDEEEMERDADDMSDDREQVIWKIHLLGWIQALLIERGLPPQ